jgi:hypothetical protein
VSAANPIAAETAGLVEYLTTAEPWTGGEFLEGDETLLPLDEVVFRLPGRARIGPDG